MHLAALVRWDLILITNLVMDYQNDGVAKALGTLFLVLSSFPPPPRSQICKKKKIKKSPNNAAKGEVSQECRLLACGLFFYWHLEL